MKFSAKLTRVSKVASILGFSLMPSLSNGATISTGVSIKFSGTAFWSTVGAETSYEFIVHWDPSQAGYRINRDAYDRIYYHSFSDESLHGPGLEVAARIGEEQFFFSSLDPALGRSLVNLIDQPGDQLDRFTLWFGEPDMGWDFLELEFASISNDRLVQPAPDWNSTVFDFTGDYAVTRVRYHRWGGSGSLNDDMGEVTMSVVPEPSSFLLMVSGGVAGMAMRRRVRRRHGATFE